MTTSGGRRHPRVLVLGASGLLGCSLCPWLAQSHEVITHSRSSPTDYRIELADRAATSKMLAHAQPDVIINLAALTNVDACETNPSLAYQANVVTVESLVAGIQNQTPGAYLINVSTDHVYDGQEPSSETAAHLVNYYAFSKYAGELAALAVRSASLRTNFFGKSYQVARVSFTDWLYRAAIEGRAITVFEDVLFSPLSIQSLCSVIEKTINQQPVGVFNAGSRNGMSKADFSFAFAEEAGISSASFARGLAGQVGRLTARRPKDMRMDVASIEAALGYAMPELQAEIQKAAKEYRNVSS